ncbi:hypothetical protein BLNAU_164 [Blattamonas nauphoetae]|uniref:Uncharacterized protein n=1 Tax=Blattamonas nauphoetae TaxID=2049346 RepID=A0ABQ9YMT7_9EUKA|nr:hypothetical protein BLNAU_164 [Blattamonas nauphoetae]
MKWPPAQPVEILSAPTINYNDVNTSPASEYHPSCHPENNQCRWRTIRMKRVCNLKVASIKHENQEFTIDEGLITIGLT